MVGQAADQRALPGAMALRPPGRASKPAMVLLYRKPRPSVTTPDPPGPANEWFMAMAAPWSSMTTTLVVCADAPLEAELVPGSARRRALANIAATSTATEEGSPRWAV